MSDRALMHELLHTIDSGHGVCLATVVETSRSVPRHAGSKMLIHRDGRTVGSVGGGEMEARVVAEAKLALADGATRLLKYDLVSPKAGDPGVCGGAATISVVPYMPTPTIYVIGCGHVGTAVVELAHWMGFRAVAVDDRPELATREHVPLADEIYCGPIDANAPQITSETHVVLVTRNMNVDLDALPYLLGTEARSIGVMGSDRRWSKTREVLLERGIEATLLAHVKAPIGLELNAETPKEIAVSILAEIVALRRTMGRTISPTEVAGT